MIHKGEEPPISGEKGIVNLFFPSCNMQCIYCQNYEISRRGTQGTLRSIDEVCDSIIELLPLSEGNLGFVSPSHFVLQMINIVKELWNRGHHPTIIYNSNGYDSPETIGLLEGIVDVWLPDFKYSDDSLAVELSEAPGYSTIALAAVKAMVHQVGVTLQTDDRGIARRGIIIRHLVLPGFVDNSIGVLKTIAEELSPNLHISLMSQYYPPINFKVSPPKLGGVTISQLADGGGGLSPATRKTINDKRKTRNLEQGTWNSLSRPITPIEYQKVLDSFHNLGFSRGCVQDYDSHLSYRPDFSKKDPFEKTDL